MLLRILQVQLAHPKLLNNNSIPTFSYENIYFTSHVNFYILGRRNSPENTNSRKPKAAYGPCTKKIIHKYSEALWEYRFIQVLHFHDDGNLEENMNKSELVLCSCCCKAVVVVFRLTNASGSTNLTHPGMVRVKFSIIDSVQVPPPWDNWLHAKSRATIRKYLEKAAIANIRNR